MFRKLIRIGASALMAAFVLSAAPALAQGKTTPPPQSGDQKIVPVDLNTADTKTLTSVPGVGDTLAAAIIKARPFKSVDDLKNVKGIGAGAKFEQLKKYFMVADAKPTTPTGGTTTGAASTAGAATTSGSGGTASTGKSSGGSKGGSKTSGASTSSSKLAPGEKININTATEKDLDRLPDIGKVKAKAIVDYRTAHGPFATIDDIMKVEGIKEGIFAKIKDSIVVK